MRFFGLVIVALLVGPAHAQEEKCKIEDYVARQSGQFVIINGATTCDRGHLAYRLYDGEKFIASGTARIRGFVFQTIEEIAVPEEMNMKYVIDRQP